MKIHRFPLLVSLLILGTFLLSACTGVGAINTFPGITATQNTVYLADQGSIFAINAANGTMTWRFPDKADNSKPFYAPPAVTDNLIVVGNYGNMLYGLDTSGKQKWAFDSKGGHFVGGPLVVKDTVLAPSSNNNLYALNAADGTQRWAYETKNAVWATPVSDGQIIYQPALDHNLYALKLADGSLVWKKDLGSALLSAPILTQDGTLYLSSMGGDVIAVKASDGSVLWTAKIGGRIWSTPAFNQDLLFVGNSDGKVFAVSAKDGSIKWQKDAGSPILAGGLVTPDSVIFTTEGGLVIAWPFSGEKELWRQTINGKLYTTPAVAGQMLVVAVTQGDKLLQAFNLNGQLAWPFVAPK